MRFASVLSLGRSVTWLPNFLGWVDLLTHGAPQARFARQSSAISFQMKWFFWPPFLSDSPFLLLNLARRQCHAYAIGLYTRPEIKSWPDVKFCAHAQCVLPRCWPRSTLLFAILKINNRKPYLRWRTAPRPKGDRRPSPTGRPRREVPSKKKDLFYLVTRSK